MSTFRGVESAVSSARRLERLLLIMHPTKAEDFSAPEKERHFANISKDTNTAFHFDNGEYVVFRRGTRYTTMVPPSDIPIVELPTTEDSRFLLDSLKSALSESAEGDHPFLRMSAVSFIESLYRPNNDTSTRNLDLDCMLSVGQCLLEQPSLRLSVDRLNLVPSSLRASFVQSWALSSYNRLLTEYRQRRIVGECAAWGIATFRLLLSAGLTDHSVQMFYKMDSEIQSRQPARGPSEPLIVVDPSIYLTSKELPFRLALIAGVRVAQFLQSDGERSVKIAQNRCLCDAFFEGLFSAWLDFSAAKRLHFAVDLALAQRRDEIEEGMEELIREHKADWVLCEEYLAHIASSFRLATATREEAESTRLVDRTDAFRFEQWIVMLAHYSDPYDADIELLDAFIQLRIPRFLFDLGRVAVRVLRGDHSRRNRERLGYIASRLEDLMAICVLFVEQNYLRFVYAVLAYSEAEVGNHKSAEEYRYRTTDEYFENRIRDAVSDFSSSNIEKSIKKDPSLLDYERAEENR